MLRKATSERLSAFSDGVFAVLITVLVVDLRPPVGPTFLALLPLLRYATEVSPRLRWFNFGHLFSVSLLPIATAWMAVSELAAQPVAFYAGVFWFVNLTYFHLVWELIEETPDNHKARRISSVMRVRSIETLRVFGCDRSPEISPSWARDVLHVFECLSQAGCPWAGA